jgi:hypothetical protein
MKKILALAIAICFAALPALAQTADATNPAAPVATPPPAAAAPAASAATPPPAAAPAEMHHPESHMAKMFDKIDANHDGKISHDEWIAHCEEKFKHIAGDSKEISKDAFKKWEEEEEKEEKEDKGEDAKKDAK